MSVSYTHLDVYKRQLYGDETTTSDNIASMVKISQSSKP